MNTPVASFFIFDEATNLRPARPICQHQTSTGYVTLDLYLLGTSCNFSLNPPKSSWDLNGVGQVHLPQLTEYHTISFRPQNPVATPPQEYNFLFVPVTDRSLGRRLDLPCVGALHPDHQVGSGERTSS